MPLTLPCPFAWCDLGRLLSQHQVAAVRTARPQGTIAGRVCAAGRTRVCGGKPLLQALRRRITAAGYASSTCCRLQQCVSGAVSHPCMRLPAQLPGSLSHLPTNLFCNEWCAGSQRPASLGRPWGPLVPPARARYKSGRLRRRSSPAAATGDHQAVAQLQATLPRHGNPRPACPVRLVSTSDSSSSRIP